MLNAFPPIAFVPITDPDRARAFYRDTLGLELIEDQLPFALVFRTGSIMLRATPVKSFTPHPFTVLGWRVTGINALAQKLTATGVVFERFPGMQQDEDGVWTTPGAKVAWFKDPDGNLLSISEQ